jgi:transposase
LAFAAYQPVDEVVWLGFCRVVELEGSAMAMGRSGAVQDDLMATWSEMPRSPGHAFYDRLQSVLLAAGFDAFVEQVCKPYYAPRMGAPSLPPGRYFRLPMIGYFEGLDKPSGA